MQGSIYTPQTEKETPSISICQSSSQFFSNNSFTMKRTIAVLLPNMGQICQHQSNVFTILKQGENRTVVLSSFCKNNIFRSTIQKFKRKTTWLSFAWVDLFLIHSKTWKNPISTLNIYWRCAQARFTPTAEEGVSI